MKIKCHVHKRGNSFIYYSHWNYETKPSYDWLLISVNCDNAIGNFQTGFVMINSFEVGLHENSQTFMNVIHMHYHYYKEFPKVGMSVLGTCGICMNLIAAWLIWYLHEFDCSTNVCSLLCGLTLKLSCERRPQGERPTSKQKPDTPNPSLFDMVKYNMYSQPCSNGHLP